MVPLVGFHIHVCIDSAKAPAAVKNHQLVIPRVYLENPAHTAGILAGHRHRSVAFSIQLDPAVDREIPAAEIKVRVIRRAHIISPAVKTKGCVSKLRICGIHMRLINRSKRLSFDRSFQPDQQSIQISFHSRHLQRKIIIHKFQAGEDIFNLINQVFGCRSESLRQETGDACLRNQSCQSITFLLK